MNHVMLDLETMGNGSNAAVVSIGAVFFDPVKNEIGAEFHQVVDLESAAKLGQIDIGTVQWWLKQSDEARAIFNNKDAISLRDALQEFSDWISQIENVKDRIVWGNGSGFDNVILANAYKYSPTKCPWPHWNDRDVRTIVDLGRTLRNFNPKKDMQFTGTAHNALDDAKHQAKYVSAIYQALKTEA